MSDQDKDLPLREDLARLNRLLEALLLEQEGAEVVDEIRAIPSGAQRHDAAADALVERLSPATTTALVRACGLYSQLFNIAEDLHHARRRRAHRAASSRLPPDSGGVGAVQRPANAGAGACCGQRGPCAGAASPGAGCVW